MNLREKEKARLQLDLAKLALEAGLLDDATGQINQSIKDNSESSEARIIQAKIHLDKQQPKQAMAALDAHKHLSDPAILPHPEMAFIRAKALIADQHDDLAKSLLKSLARKYPDDVRPHRLLAGLYLKLDEKDQAIRHLKILGRLEPSNQSNTRLLASLLQENDPQAAADLLKQYESDPLTMASLARLSHKLGNLRNAEEYYRTLLAKQVDDAALLADAAELACELGQSAVAIERFNKAIASAQSAQQIEDYRCSLAKALMASGQIAKAGRIWHHAMRKSPENHTACVGLIVCAMVKNRWKLVRKVKKSLSIHTSRNERRIMLAKMWHYAAAGKIIAQQLNEAPSQAKHSPLQTILEQSVITLSQAAAGTPEKADLHFHLSRCADKLGYTVIADEALHQALSINPKYVRAANFVAARAKKQAA